MILFKNVTVRRGPEVLIDGVNWSIFPGQRIGLVGGNGAGKSTLFAMILGELAPDRGDLSIPKQWKIAHLEQETPGSTQTALDYVLTGDSEYCRIDAELRHAEQEEDGEKIAYLHEKLH